MSDDEYDESYTPTRRGGQSKKEHDLTEEKITLFYRSAFDGNIRNVMAILDQKPSLINELGELRTDACYVAGTALHFACRGGHKELANLLVEKGGLLNIPNQLGDVPLTYCDEKFRNELLSAADKARLKHK